MGIMSIVKNVIEHFRKAGKTENEISGMIEQAADRATVNKGVTEKKEYKRPEIKVETSAEQFVEAVMQTGVTAEQVKTAIDRSDYSVYHFRECEWVWYDKNGCSDHSFFWLLSAGYFIQ